MPDTTSARPAVPALPIAVAGLLLGVLGQLAPSGAADAAPPAHEPAGPVTPAATVPTASPRPCPKIAEPSVPPPAFAGPAPADRVVVRVRSAALPAERPGGRCEPPDFVVPIDPVPRTTAAKRPRARHAAEPQWRPPRQQPARKRVASRRPAASPTAAVPVPEPGRAGGYAAGALPGRGSPFTLSYGRSLVYSGALGLMLAAIGVAMVGRRRRGW